MMLFPPSKIGGRIVLGRGSYFGEPFDTCWNVSNLHIGNFCSIASGFKAYLGGNHNHQFISSYPFYSKPGFTLDRSSWETKGDVVVGNDVWIGEHVTVMSGVHIGDGAVIGAMSVVAKDIPPYAVAAGNPAEVRKFRFSEDIISRLLRLRWWEWEDERIIRNARILSGPLNEESLAYLEKENLE